MIYEQKGHSEDDGEVDNGEVDENLFSGPNKIPAIQKQNEIRSKTESFINTKGNLKLNTPISLPKQLVSPHHSKSQQSQRNPTSKDHISYSIHSLKVNQQPNEDTQKNMFIYN